MASFNPKHAINNMSNGDKHMKNLSEPWFSLIKLGIKKVEGRLNKGAFAKLKKGDYMTFVNYDFKTTRTCTIKITSTHVYTSFREYLEKETIEKCLPSMDNVEDGIKVYQTYFPNWKKDEKEHGVVAVRFLVLKN